MLALTLHEEVAADDHRLAFRMVDVARDHRAAARDLVANELGRDVGDQRGAEAVARPGLALAGQALAQLGLDEVLARRDVGHLGRDDAAPRVMHLRDVGTGPGAARQRRARHAQRGQRRVVQALAAVGAADRGQRLAVAAVRDPGRAQRGQAARDVDRRRRVGVGAARVVQAQRRIGLAPGRAVGALRDGVAQRDLAERHPHIGARAFEVDLARARERRAGDAARQVVGIDGQRGLGHEDLQEHRGGMPAWVPRRRRERWANDRCT